MKRVHRKLDRDEIDRLRMKLRELVPPENARIPELLRMMRMIARTSQAEYARMCGVAPRVLANIEGETGSPTVESLEKLLRPFGFRVGAVVDSEKLRAVTGDATESTRKISARPTPTDSGAARETALDRALRKSRQKKD